MGYPNIALIGKARSGKDTAAAHLVRQYAYTRIAFADPLKELALEIDPVVGMSAGLRPVNLKRLVDRYGWEVAKDDYPTVRRFLQRLGVAMRERDEDYWLDQAADRIAAAKRWNLPVVVTDVRFANEANYLAGWGFTLARITRPGADGDTHASETELDDYPVDYTLGNGRDIAHLHQLIDRIL